MATVSYSISRIWKDALTAIVLPKGYILEPWGNFGWKITKGTDLVALINSSFPLITLNMEDELATIKTFAEKVEFWAQETGKDERMGLSSIKIQIQ